MIRHIVLFKFKNGVTSEEKQRLALELANLKQNIGNVRDLELEMDIGGKHNSYDMALNTLFDSMEEVNAYAVHPAHVKALDTVRNLCESTAKVDYKTSKVAM